MSDTVAIIIVFIVMLAALTAIYVPFCLYINKIYPVKVKIKFADRIRKGKMRKGGLRYLNVSTQMAKEIYDDYIKGCEKIKFHLKMREYEQDLYPVTDKMQKAMSAREIESVQFFKGKEEIDFNTKMISHLDSQLHLTRPKGP